MASLVMVSVAAGAVALAGAGVQGASVLGYTELAVGLKKAQLVETVQKDGRSLECRPVTAAEVPTHATEVCHLAPSGDGAAAFLIAPDPAGEARMIAFSVTAPADQGTGVVASLSQRLGKPLRVSETEWGRSQVWLQAGRQVSFRDACAPGRFCLEVSTDTFARRVARSSGLFVPAAPGT